jgi:xanthine dehydrogenase accessory factor
LAIAGEGGILASTGQKPENLAELLGEKPLLKRGDDQSWFSEPLVKQGSVWIFGGGHVAQALVPLLARLDFRCMVFDDREEFTRKELFPAASRIILGDFQNIGEKIKLGSRDYAVILTRGHEYDYQSESFALKSQAAYIGVIGSASKHAFVRGRLLEAGFSVAEIDAERVHAPIGLDIGSETPAEIAVSIAAELIRERSRCLEQAKI